MIGRFAAVAAVAFLALTGLAQAQSFDPSGHDGDVNRFGSIYIEPQQDVHGSVNVLFGDAQVAGTVQGDCNAVFGTCSTVDGGQVLGETHSILNSDAVSAFAPWIGGRQAGYDFGEQDHALLMRLASSAVVVLVFLLFPLRMRLALDRVERHPGLAAAAGVAAMIAIVPIAIVLLISLIGIPLILVEILAVLGGIWLGTGAIALLVGRRLCALVMPTATPSPLLALILGLVIVSAAETLPFLGWLVSALVWLVGLGAAILAFVRSAAVETTVHRAPIGGPPMQGWR